MRSVDDTSHTTQSPEAQPILPISRRNVLITGSAATGMVPVTGVASATSNEDSTEMTGESEACLLTIMVIGLEAEGVMADVEVNSIGETKMTDDSGTVVFEVENGVHEVTAEKERWGSVTKTIEMNGHDQAVHVPMHIKQVNELHVSVHDASLGTPVAASEVFIERYGTSQTDKSGDVTVMIEKMLEPTTHSLEVTAEGYHGETRQIEMDSNQQLNVELLPQ